MFGRCGVPAPEGFGILEGRCGVGRIPAGQERPVPKVSVLRRKCAPTASAEELGEGDTWVLADGESVAGESGNGRRCAEPGDPPDVKGHQRWTPWPETHSRSP